MKNKSFPTHAMWLQHGKVYNKILKNNFFSNFDFSNFLKL